MPSVYLFPALEGDQGDETSQVPDEWIQPAGPKQRSMPRLVQQREGLDERDGQQALPRCPAKEGEERR